ncbi:SDR family NAD(P)-dependent oxidoreductase [Pseudomonas sp. N040]|uniref:SDR family NAD(P)-dependent oxidoreductase n=1 Tax=Pseudomonas sp. N040 TaxID=2785325 RepID=UPI0018A3216E|nr:SDR family NAD(P)-dependent oxidoreductase [Pseudomonas sp. N040]MBF7729089.1 SDR family NAD(P)-dependent oxidoreductase [Pseudomonas sp. N040]MBW7012729.1 SDR family NAD(P)-dependent oxidoreductase [Pseudomonas sp. N040]
MSNWKKAAPRVAFVSGGGSGIGLHMVRALLAEGSSVAIFDLKVAAELLTELQGLQVRPGQRVAACLVDITDPLAVEAAIDKAAAELGAPDLAFNSAGILRTAVFTELPYETFELVVRINLLGSRNFAAGVLRHMQAGGHLVLVASLSGIVGSYTQAAYAASKFGVVGLADVLRTELKLRGIDVSVVCPGEISTPLLAYEREHGSPITEAMNAFAGVLSVDEAVAGILRGVQRRQFMITPGCRAKLTRFLARKTTGLFHWIVDRKLARAYARAQAGG